ncbi:MAG: response regulator [Chitinophagales bacterium]|nr:response regulator [Chitinophagales bacterium]
MNNRIEVLLVEDNPYDAELSINSLKENHLANEIMHVTDGAEALDFIYCRGKYEGRDKVHPKIILLDLKMPRVSGIEVLEQLKSDEDTKSIPVIVLTSSNLDPDIEACYRLGVNSYITKPIAFEDFAKTVINLGFYWMLVNKQKGEMQARKL